MPVTKAQARATSKYRKKVYDIIKVTVPKGERDEIKAHAASQGESMNAFICRSIDEARARDKKAPEV